MLCNAGGNNPIDGCGKNMRVMMMMMMILVFILFRASILARPLSKESP